MSARPLRRSDTWRNFAQLLLDLLIGWLADFVVDPVPESPLPLTPNPSHFTLQIAIRQAIAAERKYYEDKEGAKREAEARGEEFKEEVGCAVLVFCLASCRDFCTENLFPLSVGLPSVRGPRPVRDEGHDRAGAQGRPPLGHARAAGDAHEVQARPRAQARHGGVGYVTLLGLRASLL